MLLISFSVNQIDFILLVERKKTKVFLQSLIGKNTLEDVCGAIRRGTEIPRSFTGKFSRGSKHVQYYENISFYGFYILRYEYEMFSYDH